MEVDILVGSDQYWELITGQTCRGADGPVAVYTQLGWVLSGPVTSSLREQSFSNLAMITHTLRVDGVVNEIKSLDNQLQSFWDLESFGIVDTKTHSVLEIFEEKIQFEDGRYEVALSWKEFHPTLPDNLSLCEKRLSGLLRRLQQDPDLL